MESHDLRSMNRITVLGVVAFVGLMASSGGVAEQQNQDRTGAPGSNSPCSACHNAAGTNASASWQIVDPLTNQEVTTYLAGQDYLVRMVVEKASGEHIEHEQESKMLVSSKSLDALVKIKQEVDATFAFRCSCRE